MSSLHRQAHALAVERARHDLIRELDDLDRLSARLRAEAYQPFTASARALAASAADVVQFTATLATLNDAGAYIVEES